jgi:putative cell wall-binding protein/Tol biopolymer transport system component
MLVALIASLLTSSLAVAVAPAAALRASGAPAAVVSARADGVSSDRDTGEPAMSHDGRFVAFSSKATNLVSGTTGAVEQVYRKDLETGELLLVSSNAVGEPGNGRSGQPSISADGAKVVFASNSTNLEGGSTDRSQIYLRDLSVSGGAVIISRTPTNQAGNGYAGSPAISADGKIVAFSSASTDLVKGAVSFGTQVFAATLGSPFGISFVSLQASRYMPDLANSDAVAPSISADGSVITFTSAASNLTTDAVPRFRTQIWARDLVAETTTLVSKGAGGGGDGVDSSDSSLSGDGTRVAYRSGQQIRLRDLEDGSVTLVTPARSGVGMSNGSSRQPTISHDGDAIAFVSDAPNLTSASTTYWQASQAYRRDLRSETTTMMSVMASDVTLGSARGVSDTSLSGDGMTVGFTTADGGVTDPVTPGDQIYARAIADPAVDRIGGADRYGVAAGVSADAFGSERDVVFVATGAGFADALAAAAAAGSGGGPVLLVTKDAIPTETGAELARLKPAKIVVAGGIATISAGVETALMKYGGTVERIGGADRYAVSAAMAAAAFPTGPVQTVYLASGQVFPDALAGAAATRGRGPVLLVTKESVPEAVRAELARLAPSKIVVLGGSNTVSEAVLAGLPKSAAVTRVGGADRYTVSANISAGTFAAGVGTAYVASGAVFPDALSGSAAAIADHAPVLLVTRDAIPSSVAAELTRLQPRRIVVLGGANTISDAVQSALGGYLRD